MAFRSLPMLGARRLLGERSISVLARVPMTTTVTVPSSISVQAGHVSTPVPTDLFQISFYSTEIPPSESSLYDGAINFFNNLSRYSGKVTLVKSYIKENADLLGKMESIQMGADTVASKIKEMKMKVEALDYEVGKQFFIMLIKLGHKRLAVLLGLYQKYGATLLYHFADGFVSGVMDDFGGGFGFGSGFGFDSGSAHKLDEGEKIPKVVGFINNGTIHAGTVNVGTYIVCHEVIFKK